VLALQHGCNWTMNVGDLSFAEPPDCYELPLRPYTEVRMSHVTHTNESCHTHELHLRTYIEVRMSHVTHVYIPCHTYELLLRPYTEVHMSHDACHT